MKKYYIFNFILAIVLWIIVRVFEIDKGTPFLFVYLVYTVISLAFGASCINEENYKKYGPKVCDPIFFGFILMYSMVCIFNVICWLAQATINVRVFGSVAISLLMGVSLLVYLIRKGYFRDKLQQ